MTKNLTSGGKKKNSNNFALLDHIVCKAQACSDVQSSKLMIHLKKKCKIMIGENYVRKQANQAFYFI